MAVVLTFVKTLRTHWKKSTFGAIALSYGVSYTKEYLDTQELMREYCEKASFYGNQPIPVDVDPKTVTVILNPNANKRKALKEFQKYCAPVLHLAGICVDVIQTESEGHAKTIMETIGNTDAIVVAGGDGTLSEVITGLLRRSDINRENLVPIGVLPLGRHNTIGKALFPGGDHLQNVRSLVDASMAVIEEVTKPVDVMQIEIIDNENEAQRKPIYAVTGIQWGAYRDAETKKDKYWYFGSLRKYATYLFNGYKSDLSWHCEADLEYSPPCEGCSNCRLNEKQLTSEKRWYHRFTRAKPNQSLDYSKIINKHCSEVFGKKLVTSDLSLLTSNSIQNPNYENSSKLRLHVGPDTLDYIDFVTQGWRIEQGKEKEWKETIEARQVKLIPKTNDGDKGKWFSIDNEDYEVKSIKVTLLPKVIHMFCKSTQNIPILS